MRDRAFGMLRRHIGMTRLAMGYSFGQMLHPFVQVRILHVFLRTLGMHEGAFGMFHQGVGMTLLAMRHRFLGMLDCFINMLVSGQG